MTARELAQVVANHQGWLTDGGWIVASRTLASGTASERIYICQGYDRLADLLLESGCIRVGEAGQLNGIDWPRVAIVGALSLRGRRLLADRRARR